MSATARKPGYEPGYYDPHRPALEGAAKELAEAAGAAKRAADAAGAASINVYNERWREGAQGLQLARERLLEARTALERADGALQAEVDAAVAADRAKPGYAAEALEALGR